MDDLRHLTEVRLVDHYAPYYWGLDPATNDVVLGFENPTLQLMLPIEEAETLAKVLQDLAWAARQRLAEREQAKNN